jgi:hypothetical protein
MISRWFTCRMFIGAETRLTVDFDDAQAKLANLIRGGLLGRASGGTYDQWSGALARDGPWGPEPGMFRLARVLVRTTAAHRDRAVWPLRWEVAGPQGTLVPVLDADIMLAPVGPGATVLAVVAVCRPHLGGLDTGPDQMMMRRCAQQMIQAFTHRIAAAVMHPAGSPGQCHDRILPEARHEPETQ